MQEESCINTINKLLSTPIVHCKLSTRATKCLSSADVNTLGDLINKSEAYLKKIPNFGNKTLVEIHHFLDKNGLSFCIDSESIKIENVTPDLLKTSKQNSFFNESKLDKVNLDDLTPIFLYECQKLSKRCRTVISKMYEDSNKSFTMYFKRINSPLFSIKKVKNIGSGSYTEFYLFINNINRISHEYIENYDSTKRSNFILRYRLKCLIDNEDYLDKIIAFIEKNNYSPIFLILWILIELLHAREKEIFKSCVHYKNNQQLISIGTVAEKVGLTRERVRQLLTQTIETTIPNILESLKPILQQESKCPYQLLTDISTDINTTENTDFNIDFINWILGTYYEDYSFVGNPIDCFIKRRKGSFIALIPNHLKSSFSFKTFIENLNNIIYKQKRYDEIRIPLEQLISSHIIDNGTLKYKAIKETCLTIIKLHYDIEVNNGSIILEANSHKKISQIIYEIIKENNAPMKGSEIDDTIRTEYPDRHYNPNIIGANALRHPGIIAIGRSGSYTLKEWQSGIRRGGTIRDLASEFLNSQTEPIVTENELVAYVIQFRPNTRASSITSNLIQEQNQKFSVLVKNGIRYIALSDYQYDASYTPVTKHRRTSVSWKLLEDFVIKNGHFPNYSSDDKEEARLRRFFYVRKSILKKGELPAEEKDLLLRLEEICKEYNSPKDISSDI